MENEETELFDRETLLDLTVNFIPLGILLVFIVLYLVMNPFGFNSVISSIQFAIIGAMFAALAVLTYYSGAAISRAEKETEAAAQLDAEADAAELEGDDEEHLEGTETAELEDETGEEADEDGDAAGSAADGGEESA